MQDSHKPKKLWLHICFNKIIIMILSNYESNLANCQLRHPKIKVNGTPLKKMSVFTLRWTDLFTLIEWNSEFYIILIVSLKRQGCRKWGSSKKFHLNQRWSQLINSTQLVPNLLKGDIQERSVVRKNNIHPNLTQLTYATIFKTVK